MKLSNVFAKLTSSKNSVLSVAGGLALAAAAVTITVPTASAQQFGIGVQIGSPRYVAPLPPPVYRGYGPGFYGSGFYGPRFGYVAPGYWEHRRFEDWRARAVWGHRSGFYGHPVPYRGY